MPEWWSVACFWQKEFLLVERQMVEWRQDVCPVTVHLNWRVGTRARLCGPGVSSVAPDGVLRAEQRRRDAESRTHSHSLVPQSCVPGEPTVFSLAPGQPHLTHIPTFLPHLSATLCSKPAKASLANLACKSLIQTACPLSSAGWLMCSDVWGQRAEIRIWPARQPTLHFLWSTLMVFNSAAAASCQRQAPLGGGWSHVCADLLVRGEAGEYWWHRDWHPGLTAHTEPRGEPLLQRCP